MGFSLLSGLGAVKPHDFRLLSAKGDNMKKDSLRTTKAELKEILKDLKSCEDNLEFTIPLVWNKIGLVWEIDEEEL